MFREEIDLLQTGPPIYLNLRLKEVISGIIDSGVDSH
jgi:hypothetical protein